MPSRPNRRFRALLPSRHVQTAASEPYFHAVTSKPPLPSPTSKPPHPSPTSMPSHPSFKLRLLGIIAEAYFFKVCSPYLGVLFPYRNSIHNTVPYNYLIIKLLLILLYAIPHTLIIISVLLSASYWSRPYFKRSRYLQATTSGRHVQTAAFEPYFQAVTSKSPLSSPTSRPLHLSHHLKDTTSRPLLPECHLRALLPGRHFQTAASEPYFQAVTSKPLPQNRYFLTRKSRPAAALASCSCLR